MAEGGWDGWLSPRAWIPAGVVLGLVMLGAGLFAGRQWLAGDDKQDLTVITCQVGEEGCEARQPTHWHADFALFIDGQKFNFDQPQFISEEGNEISPVVHMHEPRSGVVHVHYTGTTWDEFLRSIGFRLTDKTTPEGSAGAPACLAMPDGTKHCEEGGKSLKFIVNGVKVDGIAFSDIGDLDRVLISYGSEGVDDVLKTQWPQVSDEACIPSERCPERGTDPDEPCTGKGSCTALPGPRRELHPA